MGGVLYRRSGLTEESCSCGSTGQGTHTGEEPGRRQKMNKDGSLVKYTLTLINLYNRVHGNKREANFGMWSVTLSSQLVLQDHTIG